ncbi:sugar transporter [Sinorhizobium glycinis]|uniref:Sugar transporter n=2 Tax=Sinorhizobium glycinis TaxID=1472378 RepID=A0A178XXW7_9HYPH|nr:sugar transporter [Sinorhizobium glycinis]
MDNNYRDIEMKGIVLWLMGVPLIVIILLYMFVF